MKKNTVYLLAVILILTLSACGSSEIGTSASAGNQTTQEVILGKSEALATGAEADSPEAGASETRTITDSAGRQIEIPYPVRSIVCVNVGALRYTCYMQAQDLVVGVEDYEQKPTMTRLYNYVNFDSFSGLPVIGSNGEHYMEAIIAADPDVIIMTSVSDDDADVLQDKTGIPVVVVPGSDSTLDEGAYTTIRIMGEVYGRQDRANQLIGFMDDIKNDLEARTAGIAEDDKPTVYVAGVAYKGFHGFDGTEANYGPFTLINARNLANETGQAGAFSIDPEKVLLWDPDYIFVDFNGLDLIKEDYSSNPDYYKSLTAVKEGRVYSQISFRSSAANLETALADAYYAASVIYPEQFSDVDPIKKAGEIFETLLGTNPYKDLKEAGYVFGPITIGE